MENTPKNKLPENNGEENNNADKGGQKNKKAIMIVIAAVILVAAGVAAAIWFTGDHGKNGGGSPTGETQVVAVTDENGEPVTDENGEVVTEIVAVIDAGSTETPGGSTTAASGNSGTGGTTAPQGTTQGTTQQVIAKPETPKTVSGLKLKKAEEDSLEITWNEVKCDGYQICYGVGDGKWNYYPEQSNLGSFYTTNGIKLTGLSPYTRYYFYVRAYNKNEAGVSTSAWSDEFAADTLEMKKERAITITVKLPTNSAQQAQLELWIDDDKVDTSTVLMNGSEYTFTTPKKYKGVVVVWAGITSENISAQANVGGDSVTLDLTAIGIDEQYIDGNFD